MKASVRLPAVLFAILATAMPLAAQDRRGLEVAARQLAGDSVRVGQQIVVIIAINKYREWNPLQNPVSDARGLKAILERRYWVDRFIELYDEQATKAAIIKLFSTLAAEAGPDDSIFIYYAGHGYLDASKTGFWIPVDAGTDLYAQDNWIPNVQIRNLITGMKARHVVLVSDSCFSGDILNITRGAAPTFNEEYFRNAYRRQARQVLTSGASETVADDSSFSRQLELVLDRNIDPYIDPYAIFDQVRRGVTGQTPLYGTIAGSHQEGGSFLFFLKEAMTGTAASPAATSPATLAAAPAAAARGTADIVVTTDPPGATILVDGREVGRSDKPLVVGKVEAGRAVVVEARLGDLMGRRELTLSPGKTEAVLIALSPGLGTLFVQAPAEAKGLRVFLDGRDMGAFDAGLYRDLPAGAHRFEIRGDWLACDLGVRVSVGATTTAEAVLKRYGRLNLSLPAFLSGATLTVDGAPVAMAGVSVLVEAGDRTLRLEHPAIQTVSERVSVRFGAQSAWNPKLDYRTGSLTVRGCPADAEVTLRDPDPIAAAPARIGGDVAIERLASGLRTVAVKTPYMKEPALLTATVAEGSAASVDFPVAVEWGRLALDGEAAGWVVTCVGPDGTTMKLTGTSPLVPPGTYRVKIDAADGKRPTVELSVEVPAGLTALVPASLVARKVTLEAAAKARRTGKGVGWGGVALGVAGGLGAGVMYFLGSAAMDEYRAAGTTAAADAARQRVELYGLLMFACAGLGGSGLAAGSLFLFVGPDPAALTAEAADLGLRLAAFKETRR